MQYIIDRLEGQFAVIELDNGAHENMSRKLLPGDAREGDVIQVFVDGDATEKRKKKIKNLMAELFDK